MKKEYLYEINFIRAVACLLVVMVHVSAKFYYAYDGNNVLINYMNQVSRIGTPLFAVMSGFLVYNQTLNRKFIPSLFLKSRITKIMFPFIIWSIIYLVYKSLFGNYTFPDLSSKKEIADFAYMFLIGRSQSHLYFIVLVIQFYILFLIIRKFLSKKIIIFFTIISFYITYIFITNKFEFGNMYFEQFINSRSFLLEWIFYFILGVLLVEFWPEIHKLLLNNKNSNFMLIIGGITIVLTLYDFHFHGKMAASNRNVLNMLNVPVAFLVLIGVYNKLILVFKDGVKWLIKIGNMSMGIYLLHPLVIMMYQEFIPFNTTAYPVLIIPYYISVIVICVISLKGISFIPLSNFIITLVKTNEENVRYHLNKSKILLRKTNQSINFNECNENGHPNYENKIT